MPYSPISNLCSEQLIKMMLKPQLVNNPGSNASSVQQTSNAKGVALEEVKTPPTTINQRPQLRQPENIRIENQNCSQICLDQPDTVNSSSSKINIPEKPNPPSKCEKQTPVRTNTDHLKSEPRQPSEQLSNLTAADWSLEKLFAGPLNPKNLVNPLTFHNQNQVLPQLQTSGWPMQSQLESTVFPVQQIHVPQSDSAAFNGLLPDLDTDDWMSHTSCNSLSGMYNRSPGPLPMFGLQEPSTVLPEVINPPLSLPGMKMGDHQLNNLRFISQVDLLTSFTQPDHCGLNSSGLRGLSDESNDQSGIYSCLNIDVSNGGSSMMDNSVSSAILDEFCTFKDANFQNSSDCLLNTFSSSQDVQSQIISASLAEYQAFSRQDFTNNSAGTFSSNVDFDESSLLQNTSWQPVAPPGRTYTKVQKTGSVGRSIDVTNFKNYEELCSAIEQMFGLEGLLNDPRGSEWKLVYADYENDVLLIGSLGGICWLRALHQDSLTSRSSADE